MECRINRNKKVCTCSYEPCDKKGICCECLHYHRKRNELPACYFPSDIEATYDRSIKRFLSYCQGKLRN